MLQGHILLLILLHQISSTTTRLKRQPDLLMIFLICSSRYSLRLTRASDQRSRTQFRSSSCRNTHTPQIHCLRLVWDGNTPNTSSECKRVWRSHLKFIPRSIHIQRVHLARVYDKHMMPDVCTYKHSSAFIALLIASIVLVWIKASAKWLNVNINTIVYNIPNYTKPVIYTEYHQKAEKYGPV